MNQLDFYTGIYYHLKNYCMPTWVMGVPRFVLRKIAYRFLPKYLSEPRINTGNKAEDLIVSFTSFPARINNVWQVVECMLRQTLLPSKIILWLSKDQFPNREAIPVSLLSREGEIFEIRMVDGDIRSHKKYLYVCREYSDSTVMLIDDDILYPSNLVEQMYCTFKREKGKVICNWGNIIMYNADGTPLPYKEWKIEYDYTENADFFFGSGGGLMFQPSRLYKDLTNIELALKIVPLADDIWLNAMVRLAGVGIVKLKSGLVLPVQSGENNTNLADSNLNQGGNDKQLMALNNYYLNTIGIEPFSVKCIKKYEKDSNAISLRSFV